MSKKTCVTLSTVDHRFKKSTLTLTSGARQTVTDSLKIIAILIRYTDSTGYVGDMYYINPRMDFWKKANIDVNTMFSPFTGYIYNAARSVTVTYIDEYNVEFYNSAGIPITLELISILDNSATQRAIYLLKGTILYTDVIPTSSVTGAIETIDTNKYKIKADTIVYITGATYVSISN